MNTFVFICIALAMCSVAAVLGLGIFSMARGGEFNKKHGNKLMRARVVLQGITLLLLFLVMMLSNK